MNIKEILKREKHVVLNAQPKIFRVVKWIVLVVLAVGLYVWKGWGVVVSLVFFCVILGTTLHLFLRFKTDRWTKSWGPYKRIPLEGE